MSTPYSLPALPLNSDSTVTWSRKDGLITLDADPRVFLKYEEDGDRVTINDVCVPAELRHRGLGRNFLAHIRKVAPNKTFSFGPKAAAFAKVISEDVGKPAPDADRKCQPSSSAEPARAPGLLRGSAPSGGS